MLDTIKEWLNDILEWLLEALLWIPRKLWAELLEGLATLINAIPVPEFITDLGPSMAAIGAGGIYLLDVFQFDYGVPLMLGAYLGRFLIRRLPLVG